MAAKSSEIKIEEKARPSTFKNTQRNTVTLPGPKGSKVLCDFTPRLMTPRCTKEACGFRDDYSQLKKRGVEVIGVSGDDQNSHQKFTEKYSLPFTLLSDPDHEMMENYGAWGEKHMYGKKSMGVLRMTYIIDEDGKIAHIFKKVKTDTHSQDVLKVIDEM